MPDELTPPATTDAPAGTPPAEPQPPSGDKRFTQEEVGRIVTAERKRAREQVLKELSANDSASSSQPAAAQPPSGVDTRVLDFRDAIADFGVPREQRRRIEKLYLASGAADADAWLTDHAALFGLGKQQQPAPQAGATDPTASAAAQAPRTPPASDRGGPSPQPDASRFDDPSRWRENDIERIVGEKDSYAEGVRHLRRRFLAGLKHVAIERPRRGQ